VRLCDLFRDLGPCAFRFRHEHSFANYLLGVRWRSKLAYCLQAGRNAAYDRIRSDCIIFDDRDLFWQRYFENGWPEFRRGLKGTFTLTGTYGTRHIEFLTVSRFDKADRAPEVLESHLKEAMNQLWLRP
jgi:alpha-L-fucosidase